MSPHCPTKTYSSISFIVLTVILLLFPKSALAASAFTDGTATYGLSATGGSRGNGWVDIDLDGDLDLYLSNFGANNSLMQNNGAGQSMTNVTSTYEIADGTNSHWSSAWGDIDNDGHFDLVVNNFSGGVKIYINNGSDEAFSDATSTYGFDGVAGAFASTALIDFDNDGDLDLHLRSDKLYQNNGAGQAFTDVTATYNLSNTGADQAVIWGDIDNDGDLDLFSSNGNSATNQLWQNNGVGQAFTDVTATYGVAHTAVSHRGASFVDIDNDGDLDIYVNVFNANNVLFINNGSGQTMTDATSTYGLADGTLSHLSSSWIDIDNDGDLDLYNLNGTTSETFYLNNGPDQAFTATTDYSIAGGSGTNNSTYWIDIDNDGDMDLFVGHDSGSSNKLYINPGQGGNYLKVDVRNASGIYVQDARVEVDVDGNNDFSSSGDFFMQYQTNSGYAGSGQYVSGTHPVGLYFGLGSDSTCKYDIRVFLPGTDPDGAADYTVENACPDQVVTFGRANVTGTTVPTYSTESATITGTLDSIVTNSEFTSLQAQLGGTGGTWTSCTATDGSFDGTEEAFSCVLDVSDNSDGVNSLFFRTGTSMGSVFTALNYLFGTSNVLTLTKDGTAPSDSVGDTDFEIDKIAGNSSYGSSGDLEKFKAGSGDICKRLSDTIILPQLVCCTVTI